MHYWLYIFTPANIKALCHITFWFLPIRRLPYFPTPILFDLHSRPQPFWHQGPVSWKTIFPRTGVGWWDGNASNGERWGAADEVSLARPPLTSRCAAQFLTGRRLVPVLGPGVANPCATRCVLYNRMRRKCHYASSKLRPERHYGFLLSCHFIITVRPCLDMWTNASQLRCPSQVCSLEQSPWLTCRCMSKPRQS